MCIRQTVTDKIVSIMESGTTKGGPRWTQSAGHGLPRNAQTGQHYRGINVLLLWAEAAEKGFGTNDWLTYKQAEAIGGQVRKGEKSVMCAFFDKVKKEAENEQDEATFYPMAKAFFLFNVAQIDGLPDGLTPTVATHEFNPIVEAEKLLAKTGARLRHGFDGAFYAHGTDEVCLPNRSRFTSESNYYATALHELSHWTGHETRLNRTFGKRFGDQAYALEELVAELSAAFTMGHLAMVDGTIEMHADYLQCWVRVLKSDKGAIFTAASQASKAADFILTGAATQ
jgi:antirestriction protein ArdC